MRVLLHLLEQRLCQKTALTLQLQQKMPQPVYDDESSLFPPSNCETFLPRIFHFYAGGKEAWFCPRLDIDRSF
jgi:hypothetical protein